MITNDKIKSRLFKRRIITENNCWLFIGPSGIIKREIYLIDRNFLVHRVSAYLFLNYDLYDTKMLICHKCRTDYCWNPEHLYIGTTSSNTRDAIKDGTFKNPNTDKTHCKYGHELIGDNLYIWMDRKNKQIHRWCKICRSSSSE